MRRQLMGTGWLVFFLGFVLVLGAASWRDAADPHASRAVELQVTAPGLIAIEEEPDVIWLRMEDPSKFAAAEVAIRQAKGEAWVNGRRFELVDYHPHQIGDWRTLLNQANLDWTSVISYGYSYEINRVKYWVGSVEAKERLEAVITRLGVPRDAVLIDLPDWALSEANPLDGCRLDDAAALPGGEPYVLMISHREVRSGQEITLAVQGGDQPLIRGLSAYLDCWDGSGWSRRFHMLAGTGNSDPPRSYLYGTVVIPDLGLDALHPYPHRIPAGLEPGWYRVSLEVSGQGRTTVSQIIHVQR